MSPFTSSELTVKNVNASNEDVFSLVGLYLANYRHFNGCPDSLIASRVGCTRQAIFSLRKGTTKYCSITFLSRIAEAFGLTFVQLLDEARKLPKEDVKA